MNLSRDEVDNIQVQCTLNYNENIITKEESTTLIHHHADSIDISIMYNVKTIK